MIIIFPFYHFIEMFLKCNFVSLELVLCIGVNFNPRFFGIYHKDDTCFILIQFIRRTLFFSTLLRPILDSVPSTLIFRENMFWIYVVVFMYWIYWLLILVIMPICAECRAAILITVVHL